MKAWGWLAALLPAALLASPALSADSGSGKGGSPAGAASAAPSGRSHHRRNEQREAMLERLRAKGIEIPSALPAIGGPASASSSAPPPASAQPLAQELWRKWRAFTASRGQRRAEHHAALVRDLGARLADPAVKAELRLHATRVAELARIRFLADNARTGPERDKLLARVDKLVEREARRHQRQLALARQAATAPGGSSGPTAPAVPSTPAAGGTGR